MRWTNEELTLLENGYGHISCKILYGSFERHSYQAVKQKARQLKLKPSSSKNEIIMDNWRKMVELAMDESDKITLSRIRREAIVEIDKLLNELLNDKSRANGNGRREI